MGFAVSLPIANGAENSADMVQKTDWDVKKVNNVPIFTQYYANILFSVDYVQTLSAHSLTLKVLKGSIETGPIMATTTITMTIMVHKIQTMFAVPITQEEENFKTLMVILSMTLIRAIQIMSPTIQIMSPKIEITMTITMRKVPIHQ